MFLPIFIVVLVLLTAAAVLRARTAPSTRSRLTIRWGDAWLKTSVIVVGIGLFVVLIPSEVMQLGAVSKLDGTLQDLVGATVWGAGLLLSLGLLTWAQRKEYI